jgi:hydrogenase maturation protease
MNKVLIYGYGNPGRRDDGLGIRLVEKIGEWCKEKGWKNIDFDSNYQLNIEDAELISNYDIVIFADASTEDMEHCRLSKVNPSEARIEFTMHAVSPAFVLSLCNDIFKKHPETYLLHIKGYEWNFKEGISNKAKENLNIALKTIEDFLSENINVNKTYQKM